MRMRQNEKDRSISTKSFPMKSLSILVEHFSVSFTWRHFPNLYHIFVVRKTCFNEVGEEREHGWDKRWWGGHWMWIWVLPFADPQDIGTSPTSPWLVVESDLWEGNRMEPRYLMLPQSFGFNMFQPTLPLPCKDVCTLIDPFRFCWTCFKPIKSKWYVPNRSSADCFVSLAMILCYATGPTTLNSFSFFGFCTPAVHVLAMLFL